MASYKDMVQQLAQQWLRNHANETGSELENDRNFRDFCDQNLDTTLAIQNAIDNSRVLQDIWYDFLADVQATVYEDVIKQIKSLSF